RFSRDWSSDVCSSDLKYFSTDWKQKTVTLKPRERRVIPVRISMSTKAAKKLSPLYSEPVQAFIALDENDAVQFTPLCGYRPRYRSEERRVRKVYTSRL